VTTQNAATEMMARTANAATEMMARTANAAVAAAAAVQTSQIVSCSPEFSQHISIANTEATFAIVRQASQALCGRLCRLCAPGFAGFVRQALQAFPER
jgi:hypothetical protein